MLIPKDVFSSYGAAGGKMQVLATTRPKTKWPRASCMLDQGIRNTNMAEGNVNGKDLISRKLFQCPERVDLAKPF